MTTPALRLLTVYYVEMELLMLEIFTLFGIFKIVWLAEPSATKTRLTELAGMFQRHL